MARRLIGTGVTNAQGIAVMNKDANGNTISGYTGVGAGKLQIVAESGNLVSETYTIEDCLFYDVGTTGTINPKWYQSFSGENASFVSSTNGLKFTNTTNTSYVIAPNISGNTTNPTMNEMCLFTDGTVCEFNIVDKTATIDLQTRNSNGTLTHHYLTTVVNPNIKLTYKDGVVSVKANNTIIGTDQSQTNDVMIRIQTTGGYFEFKDFKVYPI